MADTPKRRSRAALKELLLAAGLEVLAEEGLGLGAERLTYKRVFDHVKDTSGITVTRGSVHERIWDSQRDFQLEVLAEAARYRPSITLDATAQAVADIWKAADFSTVEGTEAAITEMIRAAGAAQAASWDRDSEWEIWIAVWSLYCVGSSRDDPELDELADELVATFDAIEGTYDTFIRVILDGLGFRPRAEVFGTDPENQEDAYRTGVALLNAIGQGQSLRRRVDPGVAKPISLRTGPDGEVQEWDMLSIGLMALVAWLFERDPDTVVAAWPD